MLVADGRAQLLQPRNFQLARGSGQIEMDPVFGPLVCGDLLEAELEDLTRRDIQRYLNDKFH